MALSDNHHKPIDWVLDGVTSPADVLVIAGDVTGWGTEDSFRNFAKLAGKDGRFEHKIFVPGNHSKFCYQNTDTAREICEHSGIRMLIDEGIEIDGITFWGSPWTPPFLNWYFMKNEDELKKVYKSMPKNLDVLITHGPPYKILDISETGTHCGSRELSNAIKHKKPRVHIFGHIHEAYGNCLAGSTRCYNVSVLDEEYLYKNEPTMIEVRKRK